MEEGKKFDTGKLRLELLPVEALESTARALTFGAQKYEPRNWEKGLQYGRVYGAMLRHLTAWWKGEEQDKETGFSHLDHAGACLSFLQTFEARGRRDLDDRPLVHPTVSLTAEEQEAISKAVGRHTTARCGPLPVKKEVTTINAEEEK